MLLPDGAEMITFVLSPEPKDTGVPITIEQVVPPASIVQLNPEGVSFLCTVNWSDALRPLGAVTVNLSTLVPALSALNVYSAALDVITG